ncbi:hypothetical protein BCR33DRAFT_717588 [Rhizoclosmatium globosum]|uniref:Nucleoplasmin-like domain-containing protein n=1 Tax=Rhizoclosmatium globosum TaxID=329046 RepID=A0A1Y2C8J2_9FUNG|nr:hypothetical protein BCR33DRAFT_717588 [Rhizoclosmatium globosum]|eukprot:ORY43360.1 hypothetical protein BCR33DRAFT_717588 [Rhizoclosmatium globosum]
MAAIAFWGLTAEPDTHFSQVVEQNFRLTNIAIDSKTKATKGRVSVHVQVGDNEFVIANLLLGVVEQASVDLTFSEGALLSVCMVGASGVELGCLGVQRVVKQALEYLLSPLSFYRRGNHLHRYWSSHCSLDRKLHC